MSRFGGDNEEGMPWGMWNNVVSRALGGREGQEALAELERALLALPEPKLVEGHLANDGAVCAVGAYVANRRAESEGIDIAEIIDALAVDVQCWCGHNRGSHSGERCSAIHKSWSREQNAYVDGPCDCEKFDPVEEDSSETAYAGQAAGMGYTIAWHLAYLNDEQFGSEAPEARYELMLAWVRRAQGKPEAAVA